MHYFRRFLLKLDLYLYLHVRQVLTTSLVTLLLLGFLNYQYRINCHDLIYWYDQAKDLLFVHWFTVLIFAVATVLGRCMLPTLALTTINFYNQCLNWLNSDEDIKARYRRFLLVRLLTDITDIEKYFPHTEGQIPLAVYIVMHKKIEKFILDFKCDAWKILTPNEHEANDGVDLVYRLSKKEQMHLKNSPFYTLLPVVTDKMLLAMLSANECGDCC